MAISEKELITRLFLSEKLKKDKDAAQSDREFGAENFARLSVTKKSEGGYFWQRIGMIFAYILSFLAIFVLFYILIHPFIVAIQVIAYTFIIIPKTWRFVSIEYDYAISDGEFILAKIYGRKYGKLLIRAKISDMTAVAPYNDEYIRKYSLDRADTAKICAVSSMKSRELYFALVKIDNAAAAIIFEPSTRSLKALRYYNKDVVVVTAVSR